MIKMFWTREGINEITNCPLVRITEMASASWVYSIPKPNTGSSLKGLGKFPNTQQITIIFIPRQDEAHLVASATSCSKLHDQADKILCTKIFANGDFRPVHGSTPPKVR